MFEFLADLVAEFVADLLFASAPLKIQLALLGAFCVVMCLVITH